MAYLKWKNMIDMAYIHIVSVILDWFNSKMSFLSSIDVNSSLQIWHRQYQSNLWKITGFYVSFEYNVTSKMGQCQTCEKGIKSICNE